MSYGYDRLVRIGKELRIPSLRRAQLGINIKPCIQSPPLHLDPAPPLVTASANQSAVIHLTPNADSVYIAANVDHA